MAISEHPFKIVALIVGAILVVTLLVPVVADSSTEHNRDLQVIIIAGQSNAEYWQGVDVSVANEELDAPKHECYYFGFWDYPIRFTEIDYLNTCSIYPMYRDGAWHIGGNEAPLAKTISDKANCDVLTINVAWGGKPIAAFLPGGECYPYLSSVLAKALSVAESKYDTYTMAGWVWVQGESDVSTSTADYVQSFGKLRTVFENYGATNCYMVQTSPTYTTPAVIAAQQECCNTYPNTVMSSTAPSTFSVEAGTLTDGDPIHYTQKGRDIVMAQVGEHISTDIDKVYTRDGAIYTVVSIIPLLVLVGLVLGAIGMFISRRDY